MTYLQNFLEGNEFALARDGLYVPVAGRVSPSGHHNIAYELKGDARYDPTQRTVSDLLAELSSVCPLWASSVPKILSIFIEILKRCGLYARG